MDNNKKLLAISIASIFALPLIAYAEGEGHYRSLFQHTDVTINADSTSVVDEEYIWRGVDQQGANGLGQQYLSFDQDKQELEIIEAETIRANGEKIKVPASDIKLQDGMLGGISYPHRKLYQITFSKLSPGDAIHLHYRQKQTKLDLPGGDSHSTYYNRDVIRDDTSYSLHYPETMSLHIASNELDKTEDKISNGTHTIKWTHHSTDTRTNDPNMVNAWRQTPYVMVSSFKDLKAIADAYQIGATEKARITPEVQALAASLVQGRSTDADKAKVIYDWVRKNIRYVASYIGDGGFVPNDTKTILEKRYGDCKDHATILEALLEASGIPTSQVLINASTDSYTMLPIPVFNYNHAINYLPSLNLFLDSTSDQTPYGLLPEMDTSHTVLVTKNFKEVSQTPPISTGGFKMLRQTKIDLAVDGSATRTTDITGYGLAAVSVKTLLDGIGPGKESDWARKTLANSGMHGSSEFKALPSNDPLKLSYRYTEKVSNFISQPEASTINFYVALQGPIAAGSILRRFTEKDRKSDFKCDAFAIEDQVEINLAPELKVLFVPKDVHIKEGDIFFDAVYQRHGNTYSVNRTWGSTSTKAWCAPKEYDAMKKAMNNIDKAIGGRLLFMNKNEARSDL
ncbi:DUF3857 and transglutaminase domain-containing protein [Undibacterium jejuense]|uniref:DUF3857 and transglutaminase domain-containing protein n=1 Tax=Undibacterium jejuense TaxID=1344949 RepID=A0A923KR85_9BURK|nr:DUF3857 and transglutaminase domain-containing protein [Undibacterium jejuense]MBC3863726.1 DUF3857 and transglutaminase domain-containing protein [Undibacterium jejuense]